jgi:hypothetical protein
MKCGSALNSASCRPFNELDRALAAAERAKVLDLPPLPSVRRVN